MIDLILFDIDGTLLHSAGVGRASTKGAMEAVFGTSAGLESHSFGGKTDWQTLTELLPHLTTAEIGARMPQYEKAIEKEIARLAPNFDVRPCVGAHEVVKQLRDREVPLGIVTGNVSTSAPYKLRAAGFEDTWFPFGAYGSESVDRNDLPGRAIARAEKYLKRPILPSQVLVIGDTVADIACARAVGAKACAVLTGHGKRPTLEAAQPDYLIEDLTTFFDAVDV